MKKIIFLLILTLTLSSQAQVIRVSTNPVFDFIQNIIPIDSTEYVINVGNNSADTAYSSMLYRISNEGSILQQLDFSTLFNGRRTFIPTFLNLTDTSYIALAQVYNDEIQAVSDKIIFLGSHFNVTDIISFGDSSAYFVASKLILDRVGNIVISGKQLSQLNTHADDSVHILKFANNGDLITQNSYILDTMIAGNVCNITELPYFDMYLVSFKNSYIRLFLSTDLQSFQYKISNRGNCYPRDETFQISDKKFAAGGNVLSFEGSVSYVGFVINDTASVNVNGGLPPYHDEVFQFGLPENQNNFIGMDFVYPDTVYITNLYFNSNISPKAVTTLIKTTLSGETIWSKDFLSDQLEQVLKVKSIGGAIFLYGYYYDSVYTNSTNPLIIKLNSEGGIQSTTDIKFKPLDLQIYPNPTNSTLNIKIDQKVSKFEQVKISNLLGQCIYESTIDKKEQSVNLKIDVTHFSKGTYVIMLMGNGNHATKKFIVN